MRLNKREILAGVLQRSGANRVLTRVAAWQGLLVLNYHRIGDPGETCFDPGLFSASEEQFADQVRFLTRNFDVVGVSDLPRVLGGERGRFAMITFDDGYLDNYEAAFPILRAYGARAVFFLATGFLDEGKAAWWDEISWMVRCSTRRELAPSQSFDRPLSLAPDAKASALDLLLRKYKSLPGRRTESFLNHLADACGTGRCPPSATANLWMNWDHVREMHAHGMQFGGHTVSHPVLARISADEELFEVVECKRRIETELRRPVTAFSYPVGQPDSYDVRTKSCLNDAGYEYAFGYHGGFNRPPVEDPFDLARVAVESHTSAKMFRSIACLPQLFAR
jgi:peptidoglycan/xylan/chitin deacetylase (PgdA/CDA1 family)